MVKEVEFKTEIDVDPGKEFQQQIDRAIKQGVDLRVPLGLIAKQWFRGNKAIFKLKGPGQFPAYKPAPNKYVDLKRKVFGGTEFPKLVGIRPVGGGRYRESGKLRDSITNPLSPDAVEQVFNKRILTLGTKAKNAKERLYPADLFFGTKHIKPHNFLLIGAEQTTEDNKRRKAYLETVKNYIDRVLEGRK